MLHSGKIAVFAVLSGVIHLAFALLFSEVTLSFTPPTVKDVSLTLITRGGGRGDIIQSQAAWPTPGRIEPAFSADRITRGLSEEIKDWAEFATPETSSFMPRETLIPPLEISELADRADRGFPEGTFAKLPAESKVMPIADFAMGPTFPEILDSD